VVQTSGPTLHVRYGVSPRICSPEWPSVSIASARGVEAIVECHSWRWGDDCVQAAEGKEEGADVWGERKVVTQLSLVSEYEQVR
jgi:hypothetical protein